MKNLKFLALVFFNVLFIQAQDFDPKYLDSLPEDIKNDVLEKSFSNSDNNKPAYRASKVSTRLEKEQSLIELKERLENDLLELEQRLSQEDQVSNKSDDLVLFGSDFFSSVQTTFMPINEPNLDSSYILDSGDLLEIQMIGQKKGSKTYRINRDGSITLDDIGKLYIAGLSLNDASALIKSSIQASYIGTEGFISLRDIRDVNILVSGNAQNPGIYTLNGNSNILHALIMAGGVNEFGSYREIRLIRNDNVVEVLDVYDLLIDGNYNLNKRLRSGDVVYVGALKNVVSINGAVKRPGKYEIKDNQNLDTLIKYANQISKEADLKNIYLERILNGKVESIKIQNLSQFKSIKVNDGDLIYIREIPYRTAKIEGAVYKPGSYVMQAGETVDDLIKKAGGYTENAYPFGAVFENKNAMKTNMVAKEILYQEFIDNIIAMSQQNVDANFDFAPIVKLTTDIKNSKPNGRIVVDLYSQADESIKIRDGDKIIIPETTNHVYIYGEVSSEGAVLYDNNENSIDFYVDKSGGYKKFADNEAIYILHPNGETERYSKKRNLFANQPHDIRVYPGSVIFVPRKLDNTTARRLAAQAYVSILGNIGVALASLSAIENN